MPQGMIHEVETIAHSVGVAEPRQMRRIHVRIVQDSGRSVLMSALYPEPETPRAPIWTERLAARAS
jgi:hypothetical protein